MGVEHVLQSAFGGDDVHMSKPGVLATSLVVTSYELKNDRPFIFWASKQSAHLFTCAIFHHSMHYTVEFNVSPTMARLCMQHCRRQGHRCLRSCASRFPQPTACHMMCRG